MNAARRIDAQLKNAPVANKYEVRDYLSTHVVKSASQSIADSLLTTPEGQKLATQALTAKAEADRRFEAGMTAVVYEFRTVPLNENKANGRAVAAIRNDVIIKCVERMSELADDPDTTEYDMVMTAVKMAHSSPTAYEAAIDSLIPQHFTKADVKCVVETEPEEEHDFSSYESSDALTRYSESAVA